MIFLCSGTWCLKFETKAVIFLARKQIRKYAEEGCEGFFCLRLFFCVFVSADFVFVGY